MKRFLLVAACIVCALVLAGPAIAFTLGAADLIGTVIPGVNSNLDSEIIYSNGIIALHNSGTPTGTALSTANQLNNLALVDGSNVPAGQLDLVSLTGAVTVDPPANFVLSGTSYYYVYAKFGGYVGLFWLGGQTGTFEAPFFTGLTPPEGVEGGGEGPPVLRHFPRLKSGLFDGPG